MRFLPTAFGKSHNRDAHPAFQADVNGLAGFVEMIHPAKAKRLRALYEQIQWA